MLVSQKRLPWSKLNFHLQVVTNWREFGLRNGCCMSFSSQCSMKWTGTDTCRNYACYLSLWANVSFNHANLEGQFSRCPPYLLVLTFFCLLFWRVPYVLKEGFGRYIPFRAQHSKVSHFLYNVWLRVSSFLAIWWLSKIWNIVFLGLSSLIKNDFFFLPLSIYLFSYLAWIANSMI